jgi:hypothetical protein
MGFPSFVCSFTTWIQLLLLTLEVQQIHSAEHINSQTYSISLSHIQHILLQYIEFHDLPVLAQCTPTTENCCLQHFAMKTWNFLKIEHLKQQTICTWKLFIKKFKWHVCQWCGRIHIYSCPTG